jgi:hypothetical protein
MYMPWSPELPDLHARGWRPLQRVHPARPPHSPSEPDPDSPGDNAWENDLTDEDVPDPAEREPAAHELRLDP